MKINDLFEAKTKSAWAKLNSLAKDKFGELGFATLDEDDAEKLIFMDKANKIADEEYGEFGFMTLGEDDMEKIINKNPSLLRKM